MNVRSTMMDFPLTLHHLYWRVEHLYRNQEIVTRIRESTRSYSYGELAHRVRKLGGFLKDLKLNRSEAVGSFAWNTGGHLELHLAVPLMGYVLHTINVRFRPSEIVYSVNHSEDKYLFVDSDLEPAMKEIAGSLQTVKKIFALGEEFDTLVENSNEVDEFQELDEHEPALMCYSTGTTGPPKGVTYSHRSTFLQSLPLLGTDVLGLSSKDVVMPVVPMYHISSWNVPYASLMTGAKLVLPGPRPTSEDLARLIEKEKVSIASGAPTVWIDFLNHIRHNSHDVSSLKIVATGGSEPPQSLIRELHERHGIRTIHLWGMTETQAIATSNRSSNSEYLSKQGVPVPAVEIKIIDSEHKELPWDGKSAGELLVRGPRVACEYLSDPESTKNSIIHHSGKLWLKTGDIATVDASGYVKIVDRANDLIRSGGEWISSLDLENAIMEYTPVLEAVVVAAPHNRWGERPVALIAPKDEYKNKISKSDITSFLTGLEKFPKWWLPDEVIFVEAIPKTSVGKFDKKQIRKTVNGIFKHKAYLNTNGAP